jgi:lysozyme family protein
VSVDSTIEGVLIAEGDKYTNDPKDSGGPTRWGITQRTLARFHRRPASAAEVEALTRDEARTIYRWLFVEQPGFGRVFGISPAIADELVDTGVNMGPSIATTFLQRCLNAFNANATHYPDISIDGDCGPGTLNALKAYLAKRGTEGERVLLTALNCMQGERYVELAEKRPKDEAHAYGWLKNRVAA